MKNLLILWILFLISCGGGVETAVSTPANAENITCTVAYRSSVEVGIEQEETLTFVDSDDEQAITFADMVFHAAYSAGEQDNERNLRVWVTEDGADTAVSQSTLYQFEPNSGPKDQFVGGHGFTGLNYSYHSQSSAEMQFWCSAT